MPFGQLDSAPSVVQICSTLSFHRPHLHQTFGLLSSLNLKQTRQLSLTRAASCPHAPMADPSPKLRSESTGRDYTYWRERLTIIVVVYYCTRPAGLSLVGAVAGE